MQRKKELPYHQQKRLSEIGSFIKNWRLNEGLSQEEFAHLAEIHPNTILNINNNSISLITLLKCIDAMELTPSQFFDGIE